MSDAVSLIPGVRMDFGGGRLFVLPPLSFGALEQIQERLDRLPTLEANSPEAVKTLIDATHLALLRNYPQITRAEVAELIDPSNVGDVYECLMDIGGMKRKKQAQELGGGNAVAEGTTSGAGSSLASAPTPVGRGNTSARTATSRRSKPSNTSGS